MAAGAARASVRKMPAILFVCTGNLYRSPLAAAFFRLLLDSHGLHDWLTDSVGTWARTGQAAPAAVVRAAAQFGARLESHRSQLIRAETLSNFDLVLVMERGHKEALDVEFPAFAPRVHLLSRVVDGLDYDIPDPLVSGEGVDALAASLHETLERGFKSICALASDL